MVVPEKHILSKSTFLYGCQCVKRLWLHKYKPEERDEMDETQAAVFQAGTDVGKLAERLFPGGVDARPSDTFSYQQSVVDTQRYIQEGKTIIYEAAFQFEGLLCAVDILVKQKNKWTAYEVKSTTSVKDYMYQDAAFQYYVISNSGLPLEDFHIVHLNNQYIRKGDLDVHALFIKVSVKEKILELQEMIAQKAIELKAVVANKKQMPLIEVGEHCDKPYACDFQGFCFADVSEEEPDYGKAQINKAAIQDFLKGLKYPLYFMDFETWSTAVPEQDGHWPYRQVCFQYSVQVQEKPNGPITESAYLAEGTHSSSLLFLENLLRDLDTKGSILVYNQTFENTRLKELASEYPQYEEQIEAVKNRVVDLMPIFRKHYRLPEMQGSYSIKYVLPALIPELSYDDLEIGNGGDASSAFYDLKNISDLEEIEKVRRNLLKYCGLDTWAMVKILEKLIIT
jgi:hypothetical protein